MTEHTEPVPRPAGESFWSRTRDGRRLFAERHGEGAPTVVLESGMGVSRNTWGGIIPLVAPHTTVVAYDRSGLGRSDPDQLVRDLERLTADLLDLLAGLDGPFVLVGHSWGGPIIRSAAASQPEIVAGLVLVDQSDERCDLFFSTAAHRQTRFAQRAMPVAARLGIVRYATGRLARQLPEPWATAMRAEDGTVAAVAGQLAELDGHTDDLGRLRDHPLALPDVPVVVISGTKPGFGERKRRPDLVEAHADTAAGLPQGRHVRADRSSHYVQFTEPKLVAREILAVVDQARG